MAPRGRPARGCTAGGCRHRCRLVAVPIWLAAGQAGEASSALPEYPGLCSVAIAASGQYGTPFSVAAKPGAVLTLRPTRFWSPSLRETVMLNGLWAPAVLLATPVWVVGANGRVATRAGAAVRPAGEVHETGRVGIEQFVVPGHELGVDRRVPALRRRGEEPAFGAEDVDVEFLQR